MLPIMLDLSQAPVVLYGRGGGAVRRLALLREAGAADLRVYGDAGVQAAAGAFWRGKRPSDRELAAARAVFLVDVPEAAEMAAAARAAGVLVNVEDQAALCDFYTPSVVRRGDLVIAISTTGKSPGLARRIREKIEILFGPEWAERVARLAAARDGWRRDGVGMADVARRSDELMRNEGWL